ncbi:MAG: tail fiber protein [Actinomycetota bacterium]|nr:tail fiber protein [Actinomycetota bacterium]
MQTETQDDALAGAPTVPLGDFPIGTVVPYAGPVDEAAFEAEGWAFCNGNTELRTGDFAGLFAVIGVAHGAGDGRSTFNLPDYRGTFLRGVDHGSGHDPDAANREAASTGGNTGDAVGSVQAFATGAPATAFTTASVDPHSHSLAHVPTDNSSYQVVGNYQAIWNDGTNTDNAGDHTHAVAQGGDPETRPLNVSVNYVIRFK